MKIIRHVENLPERVCGSVITIGNFDGLHLGHQNILDEVSNYSEVFKLKSILVTFQPYPEEFFSKDKEKVFKINNLRDKYTLIAQKGIEEFVCLQFNQKFANMSAYDFIESILVKKLKAKIIIIGDDFKFGYRREGCFQLLKKLESRYHYKTYAQDSYLINNERVSSTAIRKQLIDGDLSKASSFLGRNFFITGTVVHGNKLGRTIGFPTANIATKNTNYPLRGVFIVMVELLNNTKLYGVANIGNRPTIDGKKNVLEVHILNFGSDIYGKRLRVRFLKKLRNEMKFETMNDLKQQINIDMNQAKNYIKNK